MEISAQQLAELLLGIARAQAAMIQGLENEMAGVRRGRVSFNLVRSSNGEWADNASASIGVDDLDALYREYQGVAARVGPLEMKSWGRREFHMVLPSGVCLQFHQETA